MWFYITEKREAGHHSFSSFVKRITGNLHFIPFRNVVTNCPFYIEQCATNCSVLRRRLCEHILLVILRSDKCPIVLVSAKKPEATHLVHHFTLCVESCAYHILLNYNFRVHKTYCFTLNNNKYVSNNQQIDLCFILYSQ